MGILEGLWLIAQGLYTIGKAVAGYTAAVTLWAIAHPVTAILIGAGLYGMGTLLRAQPWAGADVLGSMLQWVGGELIIIGIGSWIAKQIIQASVTGVQKVLMFLGGYMKVESVKASPLGGLYAYPPMGGPPGW